jgi:hypothetical protein
MSIIHIYNDGSKLIRAPIRDLLSIPIWKGNRILDTKHVQTIKETLAHDIRFLDSGYKVITYTEEDAGHNQIQQRYIVDGQHRIAVIQELYNPLSDTFDITYTEKEVANEAEAIDYFNRINNTKPLHYDEDPILVANRIIATISSIFPAKKKLIRSTKTKRPYLYVEDLRNEIVKRVHSLRSVRQDILIDAIQRWNREKCNALALELSYLPTIKDASIKQQAVALEFALAVDVGCKWLDECI